MSKIKLTKTELKTQRDLLKRFTRFLPTLQLKKQQLQMEVQRVRDEIREVEERAKEIRGRISDWVEIFSSVDFPVQEIDSLVKILDIQTEERNVAGVDVPFFLGIEFQKPEYDFFDTPAWFDAALKQVREMVELHWQEKTMYKRLERLEHELRVTNQRVNLFEKVKIPECRDNIRQIKIYLGDQETAAVARSKIAKRKMQAVAV